MSNSDGDKWNDNHDDEDTEDEGSTSQTQQNNMLLAMAATIATKYGLETGRKVSVQEQVAIFLYIVGGDIQNRNVQERFQHSRETISKYFKKVLKAITMMFIDWVRPQPRNGLHPYIRRNRKYYPHFKVNN
ncbi:hypothetical protein ACSBR1_031973 [Camellia fascicularis]